MYLLDYNRNLEKLIFDKEVKSHEFVELIGNMDLSHSVNYEKRDLYLKSIGCRLFKFCKEKKYKRKKLQIKINYDIRYISKKAIKNSIKLFLKKIIGLNIVISINIVKYKEHLNFYNRYSAGNTIKGLSQDEIDMLLNQ